MRAYGWMTASLAAVIVLGASSAAQAATVQALSDVVFTAAGGETNDVSVTSTDGLSFTLEDTGAALDAGSGCTQVTAHQATCSLPLGSHPTVRVDLGDGSDTADLSGVETVPVDVTAGAGDDVVTGGRGDDVLDGGAGDDLLDGGRGADRITGGDGVDTVVYAHRTAAVLVDLASDQPIDGERGEGDTITGVENATGGEGNDTLRGDVGPNRLDGAEGDDRLDGRGGADLLVGGAGFDIADYSARTEDLHLTIGGGPVSGGPSDGAAGARDRIDDSVEQLIGGSGNDVLTGNDSDNALDGGPGADILNGGGGEDAADYTSRDEPVALDDSGKPTSGSALDGPPGARDTVMPDVEDLWGGHGDDTLQGGPGDNLLAGGPGADTLRGGGGEDAADYSERTTAVVAALDGLPDSGNELDGPVGARDTIATDVEDLLGGSGNDTLTGSTSLNYIAGGPGDDLIDARGPGADYADCGDGNDVAWVAPDDIAASDCERIGAGPDVTGPATGNDRIPPQVRVSLLRGQRLATVVAGGLRVHFTCSETCSLDARLLLGRSSARRLGIKLAPARTLVARTPARRDGPGQGGLTLTLTRRVTARLRKAARVDFTLYVKGRDASGNITRVARRVELLAGKARIARS